MAALSESAPPVMSGPVLAGVGADDAHAGDAIALGRALAELLDAPLEIVTAPDQSPADRLRDTAEHDHAVLIVPRRAEAA